jgi:hypothetical protein
MRDGNAFLSRICHLKFEVDNSMHLTGWSLICLVQLKLKESTQAQLCCHTPATPVVAMWVTSAMMCGDSQYAAASIFRITE